MPTAPVPLCADLRSHCSVCHAHYAFRVMTSSYFGGANAVLIVFDLTDQKSLDAVEKWIKEAQSFADKSKPLQFLIVGNKKDLEVFHGPA
jgi:GTPase SAR1 family protein